MGQGIRREFVVGAPPAPFSPTRCAWPENAYRVAGGRSPHHSPSGHRHSTHILHPLGGGVPVSPMGAARAASVATGMSPIATPYLFSIGPFHNDCRTPPCRNRNPVSPTPRRRRILDQDARRPRMPNIRCAEIRQGFHRREIIIEGETGCGRQQRVRSKQLVPVYGASRRHRWSRRPALDGGVRTVP